MLLDKIKSLAAAIGLGLLVTALAGFAGLRWVTQQHHATIPDAWHVVTHYPASRWSNDLQLVGLAVVIIGIAVAALFGWLLRNARWTYRPRSLESSEATIELVTKSAPKDQPRIFAGNYAGKPLHVSIEDRGLVIGPPGTGKTSFLVNQVLQVAKAKLSFAIIDIKPELHEILATALKNAGYRVLRINPARDDPNADHWNPLDDLTDETEIAELCAALLPIGDPRDKPFVDAQLDWLKAAVFHVKSQPGGSLPGAFNLLSSQTNAKALVQILVNSPSNTAARIAQRIAVGLSGDKPDPLILQGLTGALRTLDYLGLPGVQSALGHSDCSIRGIGQQNQPPTALFLQFEEAKLKALGTLLAFMATGLLTILIDTVKQRRAVALFLDELGNMPPIPGLAEKLNTIRSRHLPTWLYFQSVEQIERRYGQGAAAIFFGAADVQMVFRLNDQPTRKLISELVGTTEREKISHTASSSADSNRSSTSRSWETVNVVEPHALGELRPGEVVTLYRGAAAKGQATPYFVDFPALRQK